MINYKNKHKKYKAKYIALIDRLKKDSLVNSRHFIKAYKQHHYNMSRTFNRPVSIKQFGGKVRYIPYKGKTYELHIDKDNTGYDITVVSLSKEVCVLVTMPLNKDPTIVQNITFYQDCAREGLQKGQGEQMFQFVLDYLRANKDVYNISRLVLSDTSYLYCNTCSKSIRLARLRMLTKGGTWYMKFGFRPYDQENNSRSEYLDKVIRYNRERGSKLKTSEIDIIKIVVKMDRKEKSRTNIREVMRLSKKYRLLKDFVIRLLKEFDKYCCFVYYIMDCIYIPDPRRKPILIDLYHKMFYLYPFR